MNYVQVQNDALDKIVAHKLEVERFADLNLIEALKIPEVKQLYDEIKDLKRQLAFNENSAKSSQNIEKCIVDKRKQLKKLLQQHNIKLSSLIPKYWCEKCKDSGMYEGQMCSCVKERATKVLMTSQDGNASDVEFANVNFNIFEDKDYVKQAYNIAKTFVEKIDTTKYNNFTILGGVGVGKTYLMQCMANLAMQQNRYVVYMSAFQLNQLFLNYHTAPMLEKNKIIEPVLTCEMLCIDDLGCEQMFNNVTTPMLTMIINERNLSSKKTVITSNLSLDEIRERYDYRLCSRLLDESVSLKIMLSGSDLRQTKK